MSRFFMSLTPQQIALAGNYALYFSQGTPPASEAFLMLHGFPAERPDIPEHEKGMDIAARISQSTGADVFLPHYRGLGKSGGKFSFKGSIRDSINGARELLTERGYEKLNVVGTSWGALVAMNVIRALGGISGKVALLSPFNLIPSEEILTRVLEDLIRDLPIEFEAGTCNEAAREIVSIGEEGNPREIAAELNWEPDQVMVIQSSEDNEVPVETTREFVQTFSTSPLYFEVHSDHGLSIGREQIIDLILRHLKV